MGYRVLEQVQLLGAALVLQLLVLVVYLALRRRRLRLAHVRWIAISSCTLVTIRLTLVPTVIIELPPAWSQLPINLVPLRTLAAQLQHGYYMVPLRNIGGNLLLLLPLGALLPLASWRQAIATGAALSLAIETLQLLMTKVGWGMRTFDVDDVLLNTLGCFIGYLLHQAAVRSVAAGAERWRRQKGS
ncbi:VanZ family protein [Paenibacillus sp. SYP-B4298]|uniref:VanZ family protein n=1 Tax=Paenibacillus sp. SYP-B4298 TaxID=2996034 RepID=UPI0022DD610E|nr:VanZ family protein [Paenibacillus sp. SYP-B4298]